MMLFVIVLALSSILCGFASENTSNKLNVLMPDVVANHVNDYLCTSIEMDHNKPTYITAFHPSATSKDAHHILLFGCTEPGSQKKVWNCGEMTKTSDSSSDKYEKGSVCASRPVIIYGWGKDADKTELPEDVAFKIGGSTSIKYLVLQVHYSNVDKFKAGETDRSGLVLNTTPNPTSRSAGIFVLHTTGQIQPQTEDFFQAACKVRQNIEIHPFAYRVHTHKLGLVNSAYRVRGEHDEQEWIEIGRRSPQLPQMFYPILSNITIKQHDYIAAVCTMFNTKSHVVRVGPTGDDEMCNFYIMYWVDGNELLETPNCPSAGPPNYYFSHDPHLNVQKIPDEAFRIPPPPNGPALNESLQMEHSKENPHQHQFRFRYTSNQTKLKMI